jgi:hypothetical protein
MEQVKTSAREAIERAERAVLDSCLHIGRHDYDFRDKDHWDTRTKALQLAKNSTSEAVVKILEVAEFAELGGVRDEIEAFMGLFRITNNEGKRNRHHFDIGHTIECINESFPTMEDSQANVLGWMLSQGYAKSRFHDKLEEDQFCYLLGLCYANSDAPYFIASALHFFECMLPFSAEMRVFAADKLLPLVKFLINGRTARSSPLWMMDAISICEGLFSNQESVDYVQRFFLGDREFTCNFVALLKAPTRQGLLSDDIPTFELLPSLSPREFCIQLSYNCILAELPGMTNIAEELWGFSLTKDDGSLMSCEDCEEAFYQETLPKSAKRILSESPLPPGKRECVRK